MRKHKILFAAAGILLAVVSVLSSCAGKEPEGTAPETVQESQLIKIGMDYGEAIAVLDAAGVKHFNDGGCIFFEEPDGRNAIAYFEGENTKATEVDFFPRVETTQEAFSSVKKGMSLSELVRTVGLPIASRTFGVDSLYFECADGTGYDVSLRRDNIDAVKDRYVDGVRKTPE